MYPSVRIRHRTNPRWQGCREEQQGTDTHGFINAARISVAGAAAAGKRAGGRGPKRSPFYNLWGA